MENTRSYQAFIKSPQRSLKHTTYFAVYDALFCRYVGLPITFVEVGVFDGGSLFMWRDFFGPQARIIGIDLNPDARQWEKDGFEIFTGSQSDARFWEEFRNNVGPIDILLDDGGHKYEQQIVTVEAMIDAVNDGGMLVVEDTHTSYMEGFGPAEYSFVNYVKQRIDAINFRFGQFVERPKDNRIWSIQSFESIVAFHVNRSCSLLESRWIENGGHHSGEETPDFRHADLREVNLGRYFPDATDTEA